MSEQYNPAPSKGSMSAPGHMVIEQFLAAMREREIEIDEAIIADGKLHRYHVVGDRPGKRNAWAVLHIDDRPAGGFGCNKRWGAQKFSWSMRGTKDLTPAERALSRQAAQARVVERRAETAMRQRQAAEFALELYDAASELTEHPYLAMKGVPSSDRLRVGNWYYVDEESGGRTLVSDGALIVPMIGLDKSIHSLQAIIPDDRDPSGFRKQYLRDGVKEGHYMPIGQPGGGVVLICEGLATGLSLHGCTSYCTLVAFDAGNLIHVARAVRGYLPAGYKIVICADNDAWTERPIRNPGVHYAQRAALEINADLVVPSFRDTSTKPTDFNDMQTLEGETVVREAIELALKESMVPAPVATAASSEQEGRVVPNKADSPSLAISDVPVELDDEIEAELPEPEPLRRPVPPAEPYPLEALGEVLGAAAQRICDVLRVPPAMAGQSILAAASLAVQQHANVEIDGRTELVSLWAMTIGESGERKSACDQLVLKEHRAHERVALEAYTQEKSEYDLALRAYEKASQASNKAKDVDAIEQQLRKLGPAPEAPLKPLLLVGSPTIEGVHKQLIAGLPSIGLFHDDGGEFLGGHSMAKEHQTKTAAGLSKLWDIGEFDRIRSGDGAEKHFGKRLALHLMIQPVIAETVLSNDVLTGQGFLARCLLSWPASTIGTRQYVEVNLTTDPAMRRYWHQMRVLLSSAPNLKPGTRNELEPRTVALSPDAKQRWIALHNGIEADMAESGEFSSVRAWASKAPAQILRIATVLALAESPDIGVLSTQHIDRAAVLVNHYLAEAARIVGTCSVPKSTRDAERLLAWCREARVTLLHSGQALQFGPECIRTKGAFDEAIGELERCGRAIRVPDKTIIEDKPRRRGWTMRIAP